LCDVSGTGNQPQSDPEDDEASDSERRETSDEKGRMGPPPPSPPSSPPPRTTGKPSRKPRAAKGLEKGPEREYFSPSGIKLEVIELPVKYDTREWLKYVEECPEGSKSPWCCTWQTMKNGKRVPCDYSSKKHLVKRHIEATHLCIKYVLTKYGSLFVVNAPSPAGGFNVLGARKPSRNDRMWRAVISTPSMFHVLIRTFSY
jgi:hypothetical protein